MSYLHFFPYLLICLSTIACWFSRKVSIWLAIISIMVGMLVGRIHFMGLVGLIVLGTLLELINVFQNKGNLKYFLWILFSVLSFIFIGHFFPGFDNIKIINDVKFSPNSIPFSLYLNHDKPYLGLGILIFILRPHWSALTQTKRFLPITITVFLGLVSVLMPLAIGFNHITYNFKIPPSTWIWAINNLLVVCVTEEVFFRGFVQNQLAKVLHKMHCGLPVSILLSSIIFGLAHFRGGTSYILLSIVAGLFYGHAYYKTERIESSILIHFSLNLFHFLFFTYPALAP